MTSEKATFKYLREPTATDRMQITDAVQYLGRGMTIMGWLPPSKDSFYSYCGLYKFVKYFLLSCALYLPIGLTITYITEFSTFTPGELFTSLQAGINSPGAFLKAVLAAINAWRFIAFKELLANFGQRYVKDEEQLAVHRTARICNMAYMLYFTSYVSFGTMTVLTAVLRGNTPWRIYNPVFDWRTNTFYFYIATFFEILFMGSGIMYNQVNDSYPFLFGMIIRLNIDLVKNRIQNLRSDPNSSEEQQYQDLKECIADHKKILDICDILRPFFSATIFIQFLLVGLLFGLTMINIMFFANFSTGIASIGYLLALTCQTFPFCYTCTLIDADCDELALSIFNSNWLDATPSYKSTLRHFLHNAQRNITFTAGSIFQINLAANISVAKLAFSVVTFVKQMNIFEKFNEQ
ncbi:hypothetical protein KR093_008473 [Drosophila rubida]|uniref:Odorant receptor n=1 Tax=Drosophila rubida TaxID=30044 RepID=A0AAD4JW16_9MUSC|nr:hypothetical protein KR093_008473 [Drosophila rubida]